MLSNPPTSLQTLITKMLIDRRFEQAIRAGTSKYHIKQFKLEMLLPNEVLVIHYMLQWRFYNRPGVVCEGWYENELRIFIWLLVCYSYLEGRCISKMTNQDWLFFSRIFNNRNPDDFEFQGLSILKKNAKFSKWEGEQIRLLHKIIIEGRIKNKWNYVAKQLFLISRKQYFRTPKQCRQFWINHLDPNPKKTQWDLKQDLDLIKSIKQIGKKWSQISKRLHGKRTQHMVKNRYKSLTQSELKYQSQILQREIPQQELVINIQKKIREYISQGLAKWPFTKADEMKKKNSSCLKFQSADVFKTKRETNLLDQLLAQYSSHSDEQGQNQEIFAGSYSTFDTFGNIENQSCLDSYKMQEQLLLKDRDQSFHIDAENQLFQL